MAPRVALARPWALVRGSPGAKLKLKISFLNGRKHLPLVSLVRAAAAQFATSAPPLRHNSRQRLLRRQIVNERFALPPLARRKGGLLTLSAPKIPPLLGGL